MKSNLVIVLGCGLALILQILLSPHMTLFGVSPNFVFAFIVALSIINKDRPPVFEGAICGLFLDLTGGGPFGEYLLIFPIIGFVVYNLSFSLDKSMFAPIGFLILGSCIIFEILNIIIVSICTPGITFFNLISLNLFLSIIFNIIFGFLFFIILKNLIKESKPKGMLFK